MNSTKIHQASLQCFRCLLCHFIVVYIYKCGVHISLQNALFSSELNMLHYDGLQSDQLFLFGQIKSTIALNIISAVLAMSGICYFCFALAIKAHLDACSDDHEKKFYYTGYYDCQFAARRLQVSVLAGIGIFSLQKCFNVFQYDFSGLLSTTIPLM